MGARLRKIWKDAGLTARALAAAAGWDNHTRVSKLKHGTQAPPMMTAPGAPPAAPRPRCRT
jgi:hypothetical protein